jgi:hypothetical protein
MLFVTYDYVIRDVWLRYMWRMIMLYVTYDYVIRDVWLYVTYDCYTWRKIMLYVTHDYVICGVLLCYMWRMIMLYVTYDCYTWRMIMLYVTYDCYTWRMIMLYVTYDYVIRDVWLCYFRIRFCNPEFSRSEDNTYRKLALCDLVNNILFPSSLLLRYVRRSAVLLGAWICRPDFNIWMLIRQTFSFISFWSVHCNNREDYGFVWHSVAMMDTLRKNHMLFCSHVESKLVSAYWSKSISNRLPREKKILSVRNAWIMSYR